MCHAWLFLMPYLCRPSWCFVSVASHSRKLQTFVTFSLCTSALYASRTRFFQKARSRLGHGPLLSGDEFVTGIDLTSQFSSAFIESFRLTPDTLLARRDNVQRSSQVQTASKHGGKWRQQMALGFIAFSIQIDGVVPSLSVQSHLCVL